MIQLFEFGFWRACLQILLSGSHVNLLQGRADSEVHLHEFHERILPLAKGRAAQRRLWVVEGQCDLEIKPGNARRHSHKVWAIDENCYGNERRFETCSVHFVEARPVVDLHRDLLKHCSCRASRF